MISFIKTLLIFLLGGNLAAAGLGLTEGLFASRARTRATLGLKITLCAVGSTVVSAAVYGLLLKNIGAGFLFEFFCVLSAAAAAALCGSEPAERKLSVFAAALACSLACGQEPFLKAVAFAAAAGLGFLIFLLLSSPAGGDERPSRLPRPFAGLPAALVLAAMISIALSFIAG